MVSQPHGEKRTQMHGEHRGKAADGQYQRTPESASGQGWRKVAEKLNAAKQEQSVHRRWKQRGKVKSKHVRVYMHKADAVREHRE